MEDPTKNLNEEFGVGTVAQFGMLFDKADKAGNNNGEVDMEELANVFQDDEFCKDMATECFRQEIKQTAKKVYSDANLKKLFDKHDST